jgi:AraC-like DNA-binding protein
MPPESAVFDDVRSFYRYLPISRRDRGWGLYLTGTGHEVTKIEPTPADSASPYRWDSTSGGHDQSKVVFDPRYPQPYRYDWDKGRTLIDEYGLLYINSGSPWVLESDATRDPIEVAPGSIIFLFPDVWHRYRPLLEGTHKSTSTLWCLFGGRMARSWQRQRMISPREPVLQVGTHPAIETAFQRMHNFVRSTEPVCLQQSLGGSLLELLGGADAVSHQTAEPVVSSDVIHQAKCILEDLTVPDTSPARLAHSLGVAYNQFHDSFKLATGLSPHQYRLQVVIGRAKELLEGTNLPVKDVAAALRFSDQYYFARIFKRKTGTTPSEWRARVRRERG